jgi:O-antigen ligase
MIILGQSKNKSGETQDFASPGDASSAAKPETQDFASPGDASSAAKPETQDFASLRTLSIVLSGLIFIFVILSPVFFLYVVPEHKYFNFQNQSLNYLSDKLLLKDVSGEIRKQQWRETLAMMTEDWRWLIGTGLSGYQEAVRPYHQEGIFFDYSRDPDFRQKIVWWDEQYKAKHWQPVEIYMYPHNLVLNFWTELGLAGALLFIWIIGRFFISAIKIIRSTLDARRLMLLGIIGAMTVIIVHGIVDVPYFKNDLAPIFWVLIALLAIEKFSIRLKEEDLKN